MKCYVKSVGGPRASRGITDLTALAQRWETVSKSTDYYAEMERAIYQKQIEINGRRYGIRVSDLLELDKFKVDSLICK